MTRNKFSHLCASSQHTVAGRRFNLLTSSENRLRIFIIAALAPLCFVMCANSALAESKTKHARSKSETRSRRISEKKKSTVKLASKHDRRRANEIISKRVIARKRSMTNKRELTIRRELVTNRERTSNARWTSNVKKTVIISSPQSSRQNAPRPSLVNDIVIVSLAEDRPTASNLPPVTRGAGSSANMPSIWPVGGAIRGGFGVRRNPFGGRSSEFHKGQDISAPYGAPVIATADGVVVISGWLRGYGNVVYVDHGNGISTRYGHLSRRDVMLGQSVKRGDQLGLVGSTGRSTGPHLHYEVRIDGQATNPIPYLPNIPTEPVTTIPNLK